MKKIKTVLWAFLVGLSAVWWITDDTALAGLSGVFAWREVLIQYSGVLGIGVMSLAMVLAVRPVLFESALGGLDKMYRLHKWLGIAGLTLAISHWLISDAPKWLIGLGWLAPVARGSRGAAPTDPIQQFFSAQRGLAEGMGEWAFYAAAVLMVLALIKRFPYRYFSKTHHLIALAYLALVWHAVILLKWDNWAGVLGPVMALLMLAGSVAAVMVLLGRVAIRRQLVGEVVGIRRHDALQVMEIDVAFRGRWAGHRAGQFAFLTLHREEGAHPFTISSAWANDGRLTFIIKGLGDYTNTLPDRVKLKDVVTVEGPYGRFTFEGAQQHQIWIGAGIGITPFIARMQALARESDGKRVHLFHSTRVLDPHALDLMQRDAKAAQVELTVLSDGRDGLFNAQRIAQLVPAWREADIWFCGPAKFGQMLRKEFAAMGLTEGRFHQELFDLR